MQDASLREAKARIESLLAGSGLAGDSKFRESSYRRILDALSATTRARETDPETTLELVLQAIAGAIEQRQQEPGVRRLEGRKAAYWEERKKLEGAIDFVATHLRDVNYFSPSTTIRIPHRPWLISASF